MHQRTNARIVDFAQAGHDFRRERRQIGGPRVVGHLAGPLAPGDGASDRIEHEDPAEGELAHADAGRHQGANLFDGCQRHVVVDPGEGFADIEALALAIEVAVVVGGELGIRRETCP